MIWSGFNYNIFQQDISKLERLRNIANGLGIETYLIYNEETRRYISEDIPRTLPVKCVESISKINLKGEV